MTILKMADVAVTEDAVAGDNQNHSEVTLLLLIYLLIFYYIYQKLLHYEWLNKQFLHSPQASNTSLNQISSRMTVSYLG